MKLKTIKTVDEVIAAIFNAQPIEREPIELTTENGVIKAIRIADLVIKAQYSPLEIFVETNYEDADRVRVTAIVQGFEPQVRYFENNEEATEYRYTFGEGVNVQVEPGIKVRITDGGETFEIGGDQGQSANNEYQPF